MVTIHPCILRHHRKQDGTWNVKVRVSFDRKSVYIPTNIFCTKADLNAKYRIRSAEILDRCDALVRRMRDAVAGLSMIELEGRDVYWVADYIKDALRGQEFRLDFFAFADSYVSTKKPSTRCAYTAALNALERFLGRRELDINAITHTMMVRFMEAVDKEPKMVWSKGARGIVPSGRAKIPHGASTRHVMKLANIFNEAKLRYNDDDAGRVVIPRSPFDRLRKVFPPSEGQKSIGAETMQAVLDAQTDDRLERLALDAFVVSFGLMGANMADLYLAKPVKGEWIYNRQKTASRRADKAEMRVPVPECLQEYIARLQDGPSGWWLPALHKAAGRKDLATQKVNAGLARWCSRNGVPRFTFYAARHTWASIARSRAVGVEKALVDECLGHVGEFQMADIYAERDWSLLADANRRVLASLRW